MRLVVVLALAAGCNQVYGLEPTVLKMADARTDAPGCAGSPFTNPQQVLGDALENTDYDPSTSDDPNELWVTRTTGPSYDLLVATRATATSAFDIGSLFAHNSPTEKDNDAALSADGLVLMFLSTRVMGQDVYESRRTAIGGAFSVPQPVAIPGGGGGAGIDLSYDGLTLYYVDDEGDLRSLHRPALDEPFGAPGPVLAADVTWPSVSPDQLELYYQVPMNMGINRRTRASTTVPFDTTVMPILSSAGDPELSTDGTKLYFSNPGVYVMTRTCN